MIQNGNGLVDSTVFATCDYALNYEIPEQVYFVQMFLTDIASPSM